MSSQQIAKIDTLLNPFLYQVSGSTPEQAHEIIHKSGIMTNADHGARFIALCILACAVNKKALEDKMRTNEFSALAFMVSNHFAVQGRPNMTLFSTIGHCLMVHPATDSIAYARAFRTKLGQHDLWAGNFSTSTMSEKQKQICMERSQRFTRDSAIDLANWMFRSLGAAASGNRSLSPDNRGRTTTHAAADNSHPRDPTPIPSPPTRAAREPSPFSRNLDAFRSGGNHERMPYASVPKERRRGLNAQEKFGLISDYVPKSDDYRHLKSQFAPEEFRRIKARYDKRIIHDEINKTGRDGAIERFRKRLDRGNEGATSVG